MCIGQSSQVHGFDVNRGELNRLTRFRSNLAGDGHRFLGGYPRRQERQRKSRDKELSKNPHGASLLGSLLLGNP